VWDAQADRKRRADSLCPACTRAEEFGGLPTVTRGRTANHLYLSVVGDGDPHNVIRSDTVHPRTATELLEQILARDSPRNPPPPCSASSKIPPPGSAQPRPATSTPSTWPLNTSPAHRW
jgi:hypothetical protein